MERINFRKISDALYLEENSNRVISEDEKDSFYRKNSGYFSDILCTLGINEYKTYLKKDFEDSKEYMFMAEDKDFLMCLLKEYTSEQFKKLRRAQINEVPDNYIVWLFEGFQDVFLHNKVPENIYQAVCVAMASRLDYPLRKAYGEILNIGNELDDLLRLAFEPKYKTYLSGNDNMAWLVALKQDFQSFIKWWSDIHDIMGEIRCEEINDMAEQEAYNMSEKEQLNAEIEFAICGPLTDALEHDEKYQKLIEDKNKLLSKRTGFVKSQKHDLDSLTTQIRIRYTEIHDRIIRENFPDIDIPEVNEDDIDFSHKKNSIVVLRDAIEYEREISSIKPQYIDISDINFADVEELIKKLDIPKKR